MITFLFAVLTISFQVDVHCDFRLYLHTRLASPAYAPEVQAQVALVNFSVTDVGLEEQLLAFTVARERPDLSVRKTELSKASHAFGVRIRGLEDDVLARLSAAEGDLTEDRALIEGLEDTKRIAADIAEKSAIAATTTLAINAASEAYRPVAHRGSILFFLLDDLSRVHSFYIYSLSAFNAMFGRALAAVPYETVATSDDTRVLANETEVDDPVARPSSKFIYVASNAQVQSTHATTELPSTVAEISVISDPIAYASQLVGTPALPTPTLLNTSELAVRVVALCASVLRTTFGIVNRGIFERDKLTFAVQLCLRLGADTGDLSSALVRTFLIGPVCSGDPGPLFGPLLEWMPETMWPKVKALESSGGIFSKIAFDMASASDRWRTWFNTDAPELAPLPGEYSRTADPLHVLMLLRVLRTDRLTAALRAFVTQRIGSEFVNPSPFNLASAVAESTPATPLLFVLFPGVDPTRSVESLAGEHGLTAVNGGFVNISMGQGQEAGAATLMKEAAVRGGWILLQNVHLMQSWCVRQPLSVHRLKYCKSCCCAQSQITRHPHSTAGFRHLSDKRKLSALTQRRIHAFASFSLLSRLLCHQCATCQRAFCEDASSLLTKPRPILHQTYPAPGPRSTIPR